MEPEVSSVLSLCYTTRTRQVCKLGRPMHSWRIFSTDRFEHLDLLGWKKNQYLFPQKICNLDQEIIKESHWHDCAVGMVSGNIVPIVHLSIRIYNCCLQNRSWFQLIEICEEGEQRQFSVEVPSRQWPQTRRIFSSRYNFLSPRGMQACNCNWMQYLLLLIG